MSNANNNLFPRGSEWRKWDLHIHSPLSILGNEYPTLGNNEPDWEAFVAGLEALDIAVLGITDYFNIDGYKKLLEYRAQGRLSNIHTILPNIEFRLDNLVTTRDTQRRLNFHVIFADSDALDPKDIEEHFLHDIPFFYQGSPQTRDERRKLKNSNIEALGKKLIEEHSEFQDGRSDLEIGAMCAVVKHSDITDILTEDNRFKDKYLIVLPEELSCLIDWNGQDHNIRKGLLQKSDMVFSSNPNTRSWCLGEPPYQEGEDKFKEEFGSLKPCIHGSDAHSIDRLGKPCSKRGDQSHDCKATPGDCEMRYTWIKADPIFEGLKQVFYEPADRVIIQSENPTPVKSAHTMVAISISEATVNTEFRIAKTDIPLNSGLVAVTGGKGTGKTALVDMVANCYSDRRYTNDLNSFVRRIADQQPDIDTSLRFSNGDTFSKNVMENKFYEDATIIYIAQGELERHIGEESDLNKYINDQIFHSPQVENTKAAFEYTEAQQTVNNHETKTADYNRRIYLLETTTAELTLKELKTDVKQLQAEKKDIKNRSDILGKRLTKEKRETAEKHQSKLSALKIQRSSSTQLEKLLILIISFVDEDIPLINNSIIEANEFIKEMELGNGLSEFKYGDYDAAKKLLVDVKAKTKEITEQIEKSHKELRKVEQGVQDHAKLLERTKEIEDSLASLGKKEKQIEKGKKQLEKLRSDRTMAFKELVRAVIDQKRKYEDVIALFSAEKADVLSDLDFVAQITFDKQRILGLAKDILDKRKTNVFAGGDNEGVLDKLMDLYDKTISEDNNAIDKLVDEIDRLTADLKDKLKPSEAVTSRQLADCLWKNLMTVIPHVKYKNIPIIKLSLGQKATVLIKIYLAHGDKPIIVDSHDDHLDNEFIMDELVKAIRQAKLYRQIILVSNNGNVVVNSDAEQVIIAQFEKETISYISGSLENPEIRDCALKVLEGGQEAFQKREQKYNFPH